MAPATIEETVDLPAPFSPNKATISPRRTSRSKSARTSTRPYRLLSPRTERPSAAASGVHLDELLNVLFCRESRVQQHLFGRESIFDQIDHETHRQPPHEFALLGHRGIETAFAHGD